MSVRPPSGLPYVAVLRGDFVESVHAVAACASDTAGDAVLSIGDVDTPVFLRSTAKPFIAASLVRDGTAARFGFEPEELAAISASHGGEAFHVAAVESILRKIGLGPEALQCGTHAPYYEPAARALAATGHAPSALHSNCSGKHAGILAGCVAHGEDVATYLAASHPEQQRILAFAARMLGEEPATLPLGIDGCGIPVFATSLRSAALAFARFARPEDGRSRLETDDARALAAVWAAMAASPAYVGGTGRFDTALIEETAGRIVGKSGAEGVHGAGVRDSGVGLALKVIDGAARAVPPATTRLLAELGALGGSERAALESFERPVLHNVAGTVVGRLVPLADTIGVVVPSLGMPSLPKD